MVRSSSTEAPLPCETSPGVPATDFRIDERPRPQNLVVGWPRTVQASRPEFEESFANAQKVMGWIQAQCRREALDADGIGAQVYRAADEEAVSEEEAGLLVRSLLTAGLDTTIFGIGAALYCFAQFPEQWQALRADPQKVRGAFEEVIRYISPVSLFRPRRPRSKWPA